MAAPFNQSQFINSNLTTIVNNNVGVSQTGHINLPPGTVTSFYQSAIALNATTGQTEVVMSLIQN